MKKNFELHVKAIKAMGAKARELGYTTINEAMDAGHGETLEQVFNAVKEGE